jgi:hypothetical protein
VSWKKQGLIYAPSGERWWARSHCLLPTPLLLPNGPLRIFFASLDDKRYGRLGYADLDPKNPMRVIDVPLEPLLGLGELGAFDDSGVVPSCAIPVEDKLYLYYVGFQRTERTGYMLFTGLAYGALDGSDFRRHAHTPVLDRTGEEPFSRGAPFVMREDTGFRSWYWSCTHWTEGPAGLHYNNVIRHARSHDGIQWKVDSHVCLEPVGEDEFSLGRPCVVRDGSVYRMWFSIRSHRLGYCVGYAESSDGINWRRLDELAGIDVSATGWDSEMICYPMVIDFEGERHMFYNGNRHGATGFGWAVWED